VITYSQELWGGNPATGAAKLLHDNFDNIYPAGLRVGTGFSIFYTNVIDLLGYLPASGAPNALASNLIDPSSSSSGEFGGAVTALKIDIDFSDANLTLGTAGVRFGDLFLHDFSALPALNGVTVRQFLDSANTALGGGSALYSITDLDSVTVDLNAAFIGGAATLFAQAHLSAPVPEPATAGLALAGLLALASSSRRRARPHVRPAATRRTKD
jgi:hypothetical protein